VNIDDDSTITLIYYLHSKILNSNKSVKTTDLRRQTYTAIMCITTNYILF